MIWLVFLFPMRHPDRHFFPIKNSGHVPSRLLRTPTPNTEFFFDCRAKRSVPIRMGNQKKYRSRWGGVSGWVVFPPPSNNSFPRVYCSGTCLTRISESCFPREQKHLLGTSIRTPTLFSGHNFPRKQKPLLGTPTRTPRLVSCHTFLENKSPC